MLQRGQLRRFASFVICVLDIIPTLPPRDAKTKKPGSTRLFSAHVSVQRMIALLAVPSS
jgi:hypothetical protein